MQTAFIKEIIMMTKVKLQEAGLEDEKLEDATAHIAMGVASIIDDMTVIESEGAAVKPYLTFRGDEDDELIHCGENACTYEFVYGIMKKLFNR